MPMDPEEKELRINLAMLQTDAQNYLGLSIMMVVLIGALIIAEAQATLYSDKIAYAIPIVIFAIIAAFSGYETHTFRNRISEMREKKLA